MVRCCFNTFEIPIGVEVNWLPDCGVSCYRSSELPAKYTHARNCPHYTFVEDTNIPENELDREALIMENRGGLLQRYCAALNINHDAHAHEHGEGEGLRPIPNPFHPD